MGHYNNRTPGNSRLHGNYARPDQRPERERVADDILETRTVETERKKFVCTKRKNAGGEFLRVDEYRRHQDKPNTIIVPAESMDDFIAALEELYPAPAESGAQSPAAEAGAQDRAAG